MTHLYVANTSKQKLELHYRLPERKNWEELKLELGECVKVPFELTKDIVESITAHWANYGVVNVFAVGKDKRLSPACWDTKPIHMGVAGEVIEANDYLISERSEKMAQQTLLAGNHQLQQMTSGEMKIGAVDVVEKTPDNKPKVSRRVAAAGSRHANENA